MCVCVHIYTHTLSHFAAQQRWAQHYKATKYFNLKNWKLNFVIKLDREDKECICVARGRKTECNKPSITGKRIANVTVTFHIVLVKIKFKNYIYVWMLHKVTRLSLSSNRSCNAKVGVAKRKTKKHKRP